MSDNVIQIKELTKQFRTKFGTLTAVDKVSFDIRKGAVSYTHLDVYKRQL